MKILFSSHAFAPMVGGIESISAILASEFVRAGHQVALITQTPEHDNVCRSYDVVRQPSLSMISRLARWCDVFFQNNISLRSALAAMPFAPPLVISYQTWIRRTDGKFSIQHWAKARLAFLAGRNVAISRAIERSIPARCVVIPNPYDHEVYRVIEGEVRKMDLVFVGRLVSDKGGDVLINALGRLRLIGVAPSLTIVGTGPEESALRRQAVSVGVADQVSFVGALQGDALAREMNRHSIMVVPSRWAEPFGIVALEGLACGCVVVGSSNGGLPDAIGGCGFFFQNGDDQALALVLKNVLAGPEVIEDRRKGTAAHLASHRGDAIAQRYLEVFSQVLS